MSFHKLINESLKNTNLKRIRIKTDPSKVKNNEDFKNIEGYEGYILGENLGKLKILVLSHEMPTLEIPEDMLQHMYDENKIDVFKEFKECCKKFLIKNKNKKEGDPIFVQIDNTNNYSDLESFLKQSSITEPEITNIYREFIEND